MDIKPFNESFGLALEARRRDFKVLYDCNKMSNDHECLLMHLGGIVVECFLKDLIVNRYGIAYKRDKYWYSSKAHSKLSTKSNIKKKEYRDGATVDNPGHDLLLALQLLEKLNLHIEAKVIDHFKILSCPIIDGASYINLRYMEDSKRCKDFVTWFESFKFVMKWLTDKSSEIEVNAE